MHSTPTDNKLKEEHLLNFVVNSLDEELSLNLGDNVEITAEKLYEVPPVPASAEPQSTTSVILLRIHHIPIQFVNISPISSTLIP